MRVLHFLSILFILGCAGGQAAAWVADKTTYSCEGKVCATQAERNAIYAQAGR